VTGWRWLIHGRLTVGSPLQLQARTTLIVHGDLTITERNGELIAVVTPAPWSRLAANGLRRLRAWVATRVGGRRHFPNLEEDDE